MSNPTPAAPAASTHWYTLRAISGQEKKVKQYLETEIRRNGMEGNVRQIVIPMEKVYEMRGGKKRIRERSQMPGYIFLEAILQPEVIQVVKEVPGVIGFVGDDKGKQPVPLRESEVRRMLQVVDDLENAGEVMDNPYHVGENVKVMDGPFSGFNGVVEEVLEEKKKLKVTVKIFGRNTPLELNFLQVERV